MNSSFATIAGACPWPRSKHCSASGPGANLQITSRYAVQRTFLTLTPTYWVLLKQPDKQKLAQLSHRLSDFEFFGQVCARKALTVRTWIFHECCGPTYPLDVSARNLR